MIRFGILFIAAFFPSVAAPHPHSYVEQQVLLSLGRGGARIEIVIVPSSTQGAAVIALLDRDGNGAVSEGEAGEFGTAVLATAVLTLNGDPIGMSLGSVKVSDETLVASGSGAITIAAVAEYDLSYNGNTQVFFDIDYAALSPKWFIQPFYGDDLVADRGMPTLDRAKGGSRVMVTIASLQE